MRLWFALIGLFLFCCEPGPREALLPPEVNIPPIERVGDGAGGEGGAASLDGCWPGELCSCDHGLRGQIECRGDNSVCNCDVCPPFDPTPLGAFEPCGGELVGGWRATASDFSTMSLIIYSGASVLESCPIHLTSQSRSYDLRFAFHEDGSAAASVSGPDLVFNFEKDCSPGQCEQLGALGSGSLECGEAACGICACDMSGPGVAREGVWAQNGGTLRIETGAALLYEAEYCITDDQMLVRDPSGVSIVMERAVGIGTPLPCGELGTTECGLNPACGVGGCVGGGECSTIESALVCSSLESCSWDATSCSGAVAARCGLADYGAVPGCVYVEGATECAGSASECAASGVADCNDRPGCVLDGEACVGVPPPCSQSAPVDCESVPGCHVVAAAP